jgi:glycosyltransferase involved in cell wall biosynthesis
MFEKHMSLRILAFSLSYFFMVIYALWILRKRRFDMVITMYHTIHLAPFSALLISKFARVPLVVKCHDVVPTASRWGPLETIFNTFTSKLDSLALKYSTKVLALSSELAYVMRKLYAIPEDRFLIVPNGVDTRMFECSNTNASVRMKLGLQGKKVLLYMGSVEPPYRKEGVKFLMRAMPKAQIEVPNLTFVIVGSMSKSVNEELLTLASSLGLGKSVLLVETVQHEDMPFYISAADVCIGPLCSSLETYGSTPRKVLEYMACGKPVVISKGGVSSDMVEDFRTGMVVNYGDADELASRLINLLSDTSFADKIGANARQHALAVYDEAAIAVKLDAELRKLV